MRRALAAVVLAAVTLTGCGSTSAGSDDTQTGDDSSASTPAATHTGEPSEDASTADAIEIEIEGDKLSPNGERIQVKTGEKVTLEVKSDRAGELHVHSTPEQELEFDKGETVLELTIDKPGIVDVEEHEADVVILQLEVS